MRSLKRFVILTIAMTALLLSVSIVLAVTFFGSTEAGSSEDLEQLVRNELGKYIVKHPSRDGDAICLERSLVRFDVLGKGMIDGGEARTFGPLEDFIKELAANPDPHAYLKSLRENLENPKPSTTIELISAGPIYAENASIDLFR